MQLTFNTAADLFRFASRAGESELKQIRHYRVMGKPTKKEINIMRKNVYIVIPLVLALFLNGCALFTSHYDATRHENFTKLKAVHVKLFEDWTQGSDRKWNADEVLLFCDKGDLSFREAFEFAKSRDHSDKTGQRAVKILWEEFSSNCKLSLDKKKLFSKAFKDNLLPEIEKNYGYAITGELARVNAPQ